jgi:hypothetical protein
MPRSSSGKARHCHVKFFHWLNGSLTRTDAGRLTISRTRRYHPRCPCAIKRQRCVISSSSVHSPHKLGTKLSLGFGWPTGRWIRTHPTLTGGSQPGRAPKSCCRKALPSWLCLCHRWTGSNAMSVSLREPGLLSPLTQGRPCYEMSFYMNLGQQKRTCTRGKYAKKSLHNMVNTHTANILF